MDQENNFAFRGVRGEPFKQNCGGVAMESFKFFCKFAGNTTIGEGSLVVEDF